MSVHRYHGFGLILESNLALPALPAVAGDEPADVQLVLGTEAAAPLQSLNGALHLCYASPSRDARGLPQLRLWRSGQGFLRLEYSDATTVAIDAEGTRVWATWGPDATLEDTATYLLGPVLGLVLRLRGITCMHASCVGFDGGCIAFAGASGSGKSSMAALFARNGHAVLSDDVVPLNASAGRVVAVPSYPRVRLWADSTASLFGAKDALPLIVPGWAKRYLDVSGASYGFHSQPSALRRIYVLREERISGSTMEITECDPRSALMRLIANTYTSYVSTPSMQRRDLEIFAQLSTQAPVHEILLPAQFDNDSIYRHLAEHSRRSTACSRQTDEAPA